MPGERIGRASGYASTLDRRLSPSETRMKKARLTGNRPRYDPYKNFKFRVRFEGRYVAGVSGVGGLPQPQAGKTFEPITLERGLTHDADFDSWAKTVSHPRRNFGIDVFDEAGQRERAFRISGAWVSEYQALPDLDADASAVTIEHLQLEHEGCERDDDAREPDSRPLTGGA
jgi:T4-like virus tail tube protein gp19